MVVANARLFSSCQEQCLHPERLLDGIHLAQENERRRLSAEIHDGVVQEMTGAYYRTRACSNLISKSSSGDLKAELTHIEKTLQGSVRELRRIIANLHPLALEELGLVDALHRAVDALNEEGIKCHIEVDEILPKLTPAEESTTYRIVQEALTNIRKHSKATEVSLYLYFGDNTVSVEVSDNGQGFNPNEVEVVNSKIPLRHMGLIGMKERAKLLGGYLSINSHPGEGASIGLTFPISSRLTVKTEV